MANSVYQQSVIYEHEKEICCCCLGCINNFSLKIDFSEQKKVYFTDLKKLLIQHYYAYDSSFMDNFT